MHWKKRERERECKEKEGMVSEREIECKEIDRRLTAKKEEVVEKLVEGGGKREREGGCGEGRQF
jgi:hypothetical protein